ncbi:hypothetical protein C8J55DRAFT_494742 [Lentinula edodes]|uniref:Mid2 domain-containing protein n=1 Tax=Lentinula lateritia TaxID=40482 RepID=A0A9W9B101_9AGAR|nr:hypothetical protein C8J55DRAFT_494742 [Lentinula edodes]
MILAMRLLLFWIPMVQISSVQSQNVNFPIGNVLGSNAIVSFIHNLETKAESSNQEKSTRFTTHSVQIPKPPNAIPQPALSQMSSSSTSTTETAATQEISTPQPTISPASSSTSLTGSEYNISPPVVTSLVISDGAPLIIDSTQTSYTTSTSTTSQILHTTRTPSHTEPTTNTAGPFIPSGSASSTSKPSHLGAIIGGIVGGVAFAFTIALIALLKWHRRRQISSVQKTAFNGDMMVKPPFNWRNVARSWKSRSIASSLPRRWHGSDYGYGGYSSSAVTSEDLVPKNGLAEKNGNEHKPPSEIDGDNGVL